MVLGLVGGFVGLIWSALGYTFSNYSDFKLKNSLIGAVYPTSQLKKTNHQSDDSIDEVENKPLTEPEARQEML